MSFPADLKWKVVKQVHRLQFACMCLFSLLMGELFKIINNTNKCNNFGEERYMIN